MNLLIFNNIEKDACIQGIAAKDNTSVLRSIVRFAETEGLTENSIREYIASLMANDDNILSELAGTGAKIGEDLYRIALLDVERIYDKLFCAAHMKYSPSGNDTGFCEAYKNSIKTLVGSQSAKELLENLIMHYRNLGSGVLAKYNAFKFDGQIHGISKIDEISFDSLIGLEHQKQVLIDNTAALVNGKRANNVLLFGDRGTGKSSSVKALLNMFAADGLRLIEIPKSSISDIPKLMEQLRHMPHKYILFLDDLTFETHETEYRALKIAMEGQLQAQNDNVLIYATSNRRHLIRENWSDREGGEVHVNDQMQETLSLSERFGISVVFSAPNQKEYLHIVGELLKKHGVEMDADIEKKAVVWQMNYGSKNARCAKQFAANYIAGIK
ncbi:MAG: ATP-binding protein [Clostridia bacterium]|nr:ATP-binding protein [Clostridia bacterium]